MKTRTFDILIDSLLYFIYMFLSCLVCMCAEILTVKVVGLIFVLSPFAICVIRAIVYTAGVCGILAVIAYKEGYKTVTVSAAGTAISCAMASAVYFIFCLLFTFEPFCAGGVESVSILMKYGSSITAENYTATLSRTDCLAVFFIHVLIYGALTVAFKLIGAKKRIISRRGLVVEETQTEE